MTPATTAAGRPEVTAGLAWTAAVHVGVLAAVLVLARAPAPGPPVYAVELVAAPLPAPGRAAREAMPRPADPEPAAPVARRKSAPAPAPAPRSPAPSRAEPAPRTRSEVRPLPGETPGTGSDVANVKTPGLEFPFPEYLRNIVSQVYRRWDRPLGSAALRAEVTFLILRDGTVREIQFLTRSGSFAFDLGAQGAIEAAGNARAFGPLPDGYPADVLPVTFFFTPRPDR